MSVIESWVISNFKFASSCYLTSVHISHALTANAANLAFPVYLLVCFSSAVKQPESGIHKKNSSFFKSKEEL